MRTQITFRTKLAPTLAHLTTELSEIQRGAIRVLHWCELYSMASGSSYRYDRTPRRVLVLVWVDTSWFWVVWNGTWFWCGIFLYEEVERFASEKFAQVVEGPVPYFCREKNDIGVLDRCSQNSANSCT